MMRNMTLVPATAGVFSDEEEEFFRAGVAVEAASLVESFEDLDDGYSPASFWDRLVGRRAVRPATEPPMPLLAAGYLPPPAAPQRRSSRHIIPVVTDEDEEWEWQIAIARARNAVDELM
jgi:hypothetical protein